MEDHCSKEQSSLSENESPLLLPSSDSLKKIDVPSASGANYDPPASSTSDDGNKNNYFVFLSFRGPDTRKGFVDHLYHRLKDVGLKFHPNFVFRDDEDLPFGEKIRENLISAIERSKVSIPVISENYAASKWCLRELIHIMKCKESRGLIVLPVLYKVTTDDVKHTQGKVAVAFTSSMHRFEEDVKQQGLLALRKAVDHRVFESEKFADGHEAELVNKLAEIILREQQHDFQPCLPMNLVGIDDRVAEVMKLMDIDCPDTRIIAIYGIGGIGGLPLALVVIGSLLKGKEDQGEWREMLKKLRKAPNMTVQQKLKISYDALEPKEQQIFLDVACFFIGTDKKSAIYLWDDLELYPLSALAKMAQRMLIKCDDNNKLRMHDQLRDLGRIIACPADKKPWQWRRLWGEEAMKVLRRKNDNENIEALHLDERGSREFMERGSFTKMPNLKFLHLNAVGFAGDFKESLTELRRLKWERCCDSFEATSVHLEKLVVLELSSHKDIRNPISENWRGWSSIKMERLKVLNLSWCLKLKSNPNLSACENLESLTLKGCANLKEVDPSIQYAKRLLLLNLSGCTSLKMLPEQLGELEHLEELVLDDTQIKEIPPCIGSLKKLKRISVKRFFLLGMKEYSPLEKIPYSIGKLGELVELDLSHTSIKELPESIGKLNKLKILNIGTCKIERIPSSIGKLQSLQKLIAYSCHNLEGQILFDKGGLSSLKILHLNTTKISGLPENLDQLSSLELLDLRECRELESLPKPPCSLSSLWLTCRSKELPSLSHLKHLQYLYLEDCKSLQSIPSLSHLERLQRLWLYRCGSLQSIPSLSHLKHLQELELASCESLQSIPSLSHLERLQRLYLSRCSSLQSIPSLSHLEHLQVLYLESCRSLQSIPSLSHLERLQRLNLCGSLQSIPSLSHLERLQELSLISCRSLQSIPSLSHLERLQELRLWDCDSLQSIPSLSHLEHLQALRLSSCESLQEIPELPSCIRRFHVLSCPKVERFPNLSDLENLSGLKLVNCDGLKKLDGLGSLKSLRVLRLRLLSAERVDHLHAIEGLEKLGCLEFVNISRRKHIQVLDLSKSKHLKWLNVDHCESLVEIRCPSKFLKSFDRRGCKSLKKLPDLFVEESNSKKLIQDYEEYLDSMADD